MPLPGSNRNPVFLQEIKEPTHEEPNYNSMTKKAIVEYGKDNGVNLDSKRTKKQLIQELMQAM
jgi:hypothetical protein